MGRRHTTGIPARGGELHHATRARAAALWKLLERPGRPNRRRAPPARTDGQRRPGVTISSQDIPTYARRALRLGALSAGILLLGGPALRDLPSVLVLAGALWAGGHELGFRGVRHPLTAPYAILWTALLHAGGESALTGSMTDARSFGALLLVSAVGALPGIGRRHRGPAAAVRPLEPAEARLKRGFDLALGLPAAICALPVVLLAAALVRRGSPGPAFYAQERVSRGGRSFRILKLRTMRHDAESDGRPRWPMEGDPRVTPLGRHLRRLWIDELPQLLNVLKGDMSLVGPRPERPYFVQAFRRELPIYPQRHVVRTGMTGLAQVHGYIGNTDTARRLHLDLRYVRRWNPVLDVRILLGTALRILRRVSQPRGDSSEDGGDAKEAGSSPLKPHSTST